MNVFTLILTQPLANGLILFYRLLGNNLGLAIIGFSLFLRFILNPLTRPYMESMRKMKDFAPELEKIKKKHKGDRVKAAQAQADFYKEKGINPGSGCLPYLLQIVVLIAFFNVFTQTLSAGGNPTSNFNKLLYEPLKFSEGQTLNEHFLYLDVTKPDNIDIPGLSFPLPGPILILAALVQLVSAKVMAPYTSRQEEIAKKTPDETDDIQVTMQQSMVYTFPLITLLVGLRFPSGLALYWLVFSLTQAYQQVGAQGWGGLTPWLERLNLLKSETGKKK
jgi:YidC/Oxa1 family membrane protein insertase